MAKTNTKTVSDTPASNDQFDWQAVMEHAKNQKTVLPRLKLEKGQSANVEITSDVPQVVEFEDDDGEQKSFPVIEVVDLGDRKRKTLAVSAKSLQNGLGRMAANNGGHLKGLRCTIALETYTHPKYGANTPRYVVTEIVPEAPTQ